MNAVIPFLLAAVFLCAPIAVPTESSVYDGEHGTPVFRFHKMTVEDASLLERALGSYDPSVDYNVIVDGHGTGLAPPTEHQLMSMVGDMEVLDSIEVGLGVLPEAIDLSLEPTFPAVGNQLSQPSCSAWAAAYYAYGFLEATDSNWTQASSGDPGQLISPAWTYARSNGGRDLGSSMDSNMKVIVDWGAPTMATMPFDEHEYLDLGPASAFREAPAHRAAAMHYMSYGASTIEDIKELVSLGIPVNFAIDATQYVLGFWDDNYILSSHEYSSLTLNHAQTIVGYDDTVTDDGEVGAFWVVNSWGDSWGDEGFYWFTYDAMAELGSDGLAVINYISDIEDYSPTLTVNWHFNEAPSRIASLEVGIGSPSSPEASRTPFVVNDTFASHKYPTFMCLDVSEFASIYDTLAEDFYLDVGDSASAGTISSFKVEQHIGVFLPGNPDRTSGQSSDVPEATPGVVTVTFPRYDAIAADEAIDMSGAELINASGVAWVPVDDSSAAGGSSLQSGDVGDDETTSLALSVVGPLEVTFSWRVSSETDADTLSFSVSGDGVQSDASGEADWAEESHLVGMGSRMLYWNYSKDSAASEHADTAWIDALTILYIAPPSFSLMESYSVMWNESISVSPMDIDNPTGSVLNFWYDWGDDTELTLGNPADGYSASHTYLVPDDYLLKVWAADEYDNNVSESAIVHVEDGNAKPSVHSLTIVPSYEYYSVGDAVDIVVEAIDEEGDEITVVVSIESLGVVMSQSDTPEPGTPVAFSFEYICTVAREAPYIVEAEVRDDAEHYPLEWDSSEIQLLVNSPPEAMLEVDNPDGDIYSMFYFDATGSSDEETSTEELTARWDWDGDGVWDTSWSDILEESHQYSLPGLYNVTVEIKDGSGLTSTDTVQVEVTAEVIPEFSHAVVPVFIALILILVVVRARRSR